MDAQRTGSFIAQRRKELNLTQAELAEKLHVTDKAISKWERGIGLPDINILEPLAQSLNVSIVELIQGKYHEQETINLQDAERIVADTIQLSLREKTSKVIGIAVLGAIGVACVFLLWLLISEGSVLMYSVGSLVTGLIAWAAPLWQMTLGRSKKPAAAMLVSHGAAMTSLTIQFFQVAQNVNTGDFSAIEDTIRALCVVVVLFCGVTFLLNLLMLRRVRASRKL